MRHLVKKKSLGRSPSHKLALLRNMSTSLFECGQISTTLGRAKALRPYIEKLVTIAKNCDKVIATRRLSSVLYTKNAINMCFKYASTFETRNGGYTRIMKNGFRRGDSSPIGVIAFVEKNI